MGEMADAALDDAFDAYLDGALDGEGYTARTFEVRCPYCLGHAKCVGGDEVYPHRPDLKDKTFWLCRPCGAWVGCHTGTTNPLGTPAKADLRLARTRVHALFDPLWRRKVERDGVSKSQARKAGYRWLAGEMGIPARECHVSWFDLERCQQALKVLEGIRRA